MTLRSRARTVQSAWGAILAGKYAQGRRILSRYLLSHPHDVSALRLLGNSYEITASHRRVLQIHRRILKINRRDVAAVVDCADCFFALGKVDAARELLRAGIHLLEHGASSKKKSTLLAEAKEGLSLVASDRRFRAGAPKVREPQAMRKTDEAHHLDAARSTSRGVWDSIYRQIFGEKAIIARGNKAGWARATPRKPKKSGTRPG